MNMELRKLFPEDMISLFEKALTGPGRVEEIRIRLGKPILVTGLGKEFFLTPDGGETRNFQESYIARKGDLQRLLEHYTRYSPYAFETELSQGFLSLPGGHRVGITGEVVMGDGGKIKTIKNISGMNVRIARYLEGVARPYLGQVYEDGYPTSFLIASPPGCGKTTMLRDFIRLISDGNDYGSGMNVGVADERMEIAGSLLGQAGMPLGMRTDVLSGCVKRDGILMLIRSMNPKVIAVDEIGKEEEIKALMYATTCGITLLNTIHAKDMEDLLNKEMLLGDHWLDMYGRILFLEKRGSSFRVKDIWKKDEKGDWMCVKH